jgi:1-aminocyclopropane-1-carboxylate deaminase/D-cysteine desulfhydrase-like pyridoxal-dependent ACC family enzyme
MFIPKKSLFIAILLSTINSSYASSIDPPFPESLNSWIIPHEKRTNPPILKGNKKTHLFENYPNLIEKIPHITLGCFPTPIQELKTFEKELVTQNIYFKNDGVSSPFFGGNKIRKLEFLLADAIENNAQTVITVGPAGSNCCTAVASCAQKLGLNAISMLTPQISTSYAQRNLLLSSFFGGELNYELTEDLGNSAIKRRFSNESKIHGFPYLISGEASDRIGALGFVSAAFEIKEQIESGIIQEPDYIYIALGSGGTTAGLSLGLLLAGLKCKIIAVEVMGKRPGAATELIETLFNKTSQLLNALDPEIPLIKFASQNLEIDYRFSKNKYAEIPAETFLSIKILNDTEGLKLDGTYSGKAFSALTTDIMKKKFKETDIILFWNTFFLGAVPEITLRTNHQRLPKCLHSYFEQHLQDADQGC